jgi:hypothetical protein
MKPTFFCMSCCTPASLLTEVVRKRVQPSQTGYCYTLTGNASERSQSVIALLSLIACVSKLQLRNREVIQAPDDSGIFQPASLVIGITIAVTT